MRVFRDRLAIANSSRLYHNSRFHFCRYVIVLPLGTRLRRIRLLAATLCICSAGPLSALPVLHQVAEIRKLNVTEARQGFPVLLRGIVTYFDTLGPDFFFQDASGGVWIRWTPGDAVPKKDN